MDKFDLENVPPEQLERVLANIAAIKQQRAIENKLGAYQPYLKQRAFHDAGATHRERLLMAGNRVGKTVAGAAELAFHLTGDYPEWWAGKRFDSSPYAISLSCTGWAGWRSARPAS